jgi:hypothetical protein
MYSRASDRWWDAGVSPVADYCNPYESIREHWGEELTPALADRILDAPVDHLDHFSSFLNGRDLWIENTLPDLPSGELRPVVSTMAIDLLSGNHATLATAKFATSLFAGCVETGLSHPLQINVLQPRRRRHGVVAS